MSRSTSTPELPKAALVPVVSNGSFDALWSDDDDDDEGHGADGVSGKQHRRLAPASALLVPGSIGGSGGSGRTGAEDASPIALPQAAVDLRALRMATLSDNNSATRMFCSRSQTPDDAAARSFPNTKSLVAIGGVHSLSRTTQYAAAQPVGHHLHQHHHQRGRPEEYSPVSAQGYDDAAASATSLRDVLGYSFDALGHSDAAAARRSASRGRHREQETQDAKPPATSPDLAAICPGCEDEQRPPSTPHDATTATVQ